MQNTFRVVTRCNSLNVIGVMPGEVVYNLVIATTDAVGHLVVIVPPPPADFAPRPQDPIQVYLNDQDVTDRQAASAYQQGNAYVCQFDALAGGSRVLVRVHDRFTLSCLPSDSYLPRVYTFNAMAQVDNNEVEQANASVTGVRRIDPGHGNGGGNGNGRGNGGGNGNGNGNGHGNGNGNGHGNGNGNGHGNGCGD